MPAKAPARCAMKSCTPATELLTSAQAPNQMMQQPQIALALDGHNYPSGTSIISGDVLGMGKSVRSGGSGSRRTGSLGTGSGSKEGSDGCPFFPKEMT